MKVPVWLDLRDALALHEMMLGNYGGLAGIRDEGLLDLALNKPRTKFGYRCEDLFELAAAYTAGVVLNHPFLDGNKRTGFMLGVGFLELNGFEFAAEEVAAVVETVALAAGQIKEADYAKWLQENSRPSR